MIYLTLFTSDQQKQPFLNRPDTNRHLHLEMGWSVRMTEDSENNYSNQFLESNLTSLYFLFC